MRKRKPRIAQIGANPFVRIRVIRRSFLTLPTGCVSRAGKRLGRHGVERGVTQHDAEKGLDPLRWRKSCLISRIMRLRYFVTITMWYLLYHLVSNGRLCRARIAAAFRFTGVGLWTLRFSAKAVAGRDPGHRVGRAYRVGAIVVGTWWVQSTLRVLFAGLQPYRSRGKGPQPDLKERQMSTRPAKRAT